MNVSAYQPIVTPEAASIEQTVDLYPIASLRIYVDGGGFTRERFVCF